MIDYGIAWLCLPYQVLNIISIGISGAGENVKWRRSYTVLINTQE